MQLKLRKPLIVDGKSVEALELNFDPLTGADMIFCEHEAFRKKGQPLITPDGDGTFRLEVLAKASGLSAEALATLSAPDFREADRAVFHFLMGSD